MAPHSADGGGAFRSMSSFPLMLIFLKVVFIQFTAFNILSTIALSVFLLLNSYFHKIRFPFFSGIGCFVGIVIVSTVRFVPWGGVDTWILLASSGLAIVVGSFVIEKKIDLIKKKWSDLDDGFEGWG